MSAATKNGTGIALSPLREHQQPRPAHASVVISMMRDFSEVCSALAGFEAFDRIVEALGVAAASGTPMPPSSPRCSPARFGAAADGMISRSRVPRGLCLAAPYLGASDRPSTRHWCRAARCWCSGHQRCSSPMRSSGRSRVRPALQESPRRGGWFPSSRRRAGPPAMIVSGSCRSAAPIRIETKEARNTVVELMASSPGTLVAGRHFAPGYFILPRSCRQSAYAACMADSCTP